MLESQPVDGPVEAVVFDIGGVFTVRHHEVVRGALGAAGFELPEGPERYRRAHYVAVRAMSDLLRGPGPKPADDERTWSHVEQAYLTSLGVPAALVGEAVVALVALLTGTDAREVWRQVLEENVAGFRRIVASGLPVAVVSNNNGTAEAQLRDLAICQVGPGPLPAVSAVVDSTLVGVAKPDPAIFAPALAALGTDPSRTLYVGDTVYADVGGATAAGMPVVQLDPYDLHADFDHPRAPDVGVLADVLLASR